MIVVNLWGAPSSGKSTTAAGLFFLMKINKMRVELIFEFAKELVLENREGIFGDQNYIFAEQARRIKRLEDHQYDFAITDSPLLLPLFYDGENLAGKRNPHFSPFVVEEYKKHHNINYLLRRRHTFEAIGRRHNEEQANMIEKDLQSFLDQQGVEYVEIDASPKSPEVILNDLRKRMEPPIGVLPFANLDDKDLA